MAIFPEGTRSPDGKPRRFHKGAFELAVRTRRDVIPILLTDTQSCMPPQYLSVGEHRCVIRVLPRVTSQTFDYRLGAKALADHVKGLIQAHAESDWRLAQDGRAFWHKLRGLYRYRSAYVESYIHWKLRLDPIYRQIDAFVPERGAVLDLGCGYGVTANILALKSLARQVLGVDFDEGKISIATRTALSAPNLTFELRDLLAWDYPPADVVLLVDVLHYWSAPRQRLILAKAAACLRPGGILIVRDACRAATWRHRLTAWAERFAQWTGHNRRGDGLVFLDRAAYLEMFRSNGLALASAPTDLGRGSNEVFVLRKGDS